jgi:hypothetical protein
LTGPPAAATTEMSAVGQSLTFGVRVWLKTISELSGDQSKPPTWKAPSVSLRGSRLPAASFWTGMT